jgi:hypothetical protein
MTSRAVVALGIGQCVNWGVLYYAFAVLVLPVERELGVATWVVTGAFSLALLMSAALAPAIGRWGDRDRGALVMQAASPMSEDSRVRLARHEAHATPSVPLDNNPRPCRDRRPRRPPPESCRR